MEVLTVREFGERDRVAVIELWRDCGLTRPGNDHDGHRDGINYLAVDPQRQGRGVGRHLMERAEHHLDEAGCPKINLQVRSGNAVAIDFYERLGFAVDDVVNMGKRLVNDETSDR